MLRMAALAGLLVPALAQAQLTGSPPLHEAGSLASGTVLRHTFTLQNTGRETLHLSEVRTGCGCVRSQLGQRTLKPGEKTNLPIEVHTVTQATGPNLWGADVRYRDESGREGVCSVRLRATVVPEVQLSPATLVLHTAAPAQHFFVLTERRSEPLPLTSVATSCAHVKAEASKPVQQGNGWAREIRLSVAADCPVGRHECLLTLTTQDARFPELRAPFVVVKRDQSGVRASPDAHEWLALGSEALPARLSLLHSDSDQPITIENVSSSHPAFKATWASGVRGTVRFVVDRAQVPSGGVEAIADVTLSRPQPTTLKIPLRVRLK